uniref:AccD n=1 Tax=Prototheca miyajii TaxID=2034260 RepID=UPI0030039E07
MAVFSWFEEQTGLELALTPQPRGPKVNAHLWIRCENCGVILYVKHLQNNKSVCFGCGTHLHMHSFERINRFIDAGTWVPLNETISSCDPLEFEDQKPYTERLIESQESTGFQDAVQTGTGLIEGIPVAVAIMDFTFMGGSMGSVVGEKITRLIEYATEQGLPVVIFCASGGARMQEGIFSLMQMAKISAALNVHQNIAKLLYISVLTSPTTGGVTASFAMLGDLIFAEPRALIGFAGRRVIQQTLQEQLPKDFQTSEYLLHHGLIDLIVSRFFLKQAIAETIILYKESGTKEAGRIAFRERHSLTPAQEERLRRLVKVQSRQKSKFWKLIYRFLDLFTGDDKLLPKKLKVKPLPFIQKFKKVTEEDYFKVPAMEFYIVPKQPEKSTEIKEDFITIDVEPIIKNVEGDENEITNK